MSGPVATFAKHPALSFLRAAYFPYHPNMYPADFGQFYRNLPVRLTTGGTVYVEARRYVSRLEAGPHKECGAFLRAARKWTASHQSHHFPEARSWL